MIKSLKIGSSNVAVKYKNLADEDHDGIFIPETNQIHIHNALKPDLHDVIITHELVHAVTENTSLRHTSIHKDVWEVIAHEISVAIADNFILLPKK